VIPSIYRKQINNELESLVGYEREGTNIYLLGSMSVFGQRSFNSQLSDIDLLVVPIHDSLENYVGHFEQLINIVVELNKRLDRPVEVFFMSPSTVDMYFGCLSVIAGDNILRDEDRIFGEGHQNLGVRSTLFTDDYRKSLYAIKAKNFCDEYGRLLPLADTSSARKIAKLLLRGIKFIICAQTKASILTYMEQKLFFVTTFNEARSILDGMGKTGLIVDDIIQKAFDGKSVDDWPAWMIEQDVLARQLIELKIDAELNVNMYRLYDGVCLVREMLIAGLKDTLNEKNVERRLELIDKYANDTAGVVAKLALAGVTSLMDFESSTTPEIVSQSYVILVNHLKVGIQDLRCLAASVVLLEYAFEQSTTKVSIGLN
jgi:predicted nucleotidyltransferase